MQDSTMINTGAHLLEKIENPILAILLFVLLIIIWLLYKALQTKGKKIVEMQKEKDTEIKDLNKVLLEVRESDKEMLVELKNTISRFVDVERIHVEASKEVAEVARRNNELLMQLIAKIEYSIKTVK